MPSSTYKGQGSSLNRQILALALPAFGALIASPLLVLVDSALVGHLGSLPLAGLTLASSLTQTLVGLMVFLAYSTTPAVARFLGAGRLEDSFRAAKNGLWVALGLGLLLAFLLGLTADPLLLALGAQGPVLDAARAYLLPSLLGLPAMLLVLAATGALRGYQDTRTPLWVASLGALLNAPLSWALIYPLGWGVAGSALATALVQWGMALALLLALRGRRPVGVSLAPDWAGVLAVFRVGGWLMLRALSIRTALLATVLVVTAQGPENLAAYQLTMSCFNLLAYALDALAIAAQALLAKELGARDLSDQAQVQAVVGLKNRLVGWSLGFGLVTALACPLIGFGLGPVLSPDGRVQFLFGLSLLVLGLGQPLAAYVFILDGVLMGAQDTRYLGLASLFNLLVYLPVLAGLGVWWASGGLAAWAEGLPVGLVGEGLDAAVWAYLLLWVAYALVYMGARGLTLGLRDRSHVWVR